GGRIGRVELRAMPRALIWCDQLPHQRNLDHVDPERMERLERLHHAPRWDVDELVVVEEHRYLGARSARRRGQRDLDHDERADQRRDGYRRRKYPSRPAHRGLMVERREAAPPRLRPTVLAMRRP